MKVRLREADQDSGQETAIMTPKDVYGWKTLYSSLIL